MSRNWSPLLLGTAAIVVGSAFWAMGAVQALAQSGPQQSQDSVAKPKRRPPPQPTDENSPTQRHTL